MKASLLKEIKGNKNYAHLDDGKNFVKVEGTNFVLGGKPYFFTGANFWGAMYLGSDSEVGDRDRLCRELDQLRDIGVKNLRIIACTEESNFKMTLKPAVQTELGQLNETLLQGLDFTLAEMAKRDMKAVIYFGNFWQWSGGFSQYVSWVTGKPIYDSDLPGNTLDGLIGKSAEFYRQPKAMDAFNQIVEKIILRKNTINGIDYRDDPTIMTWELLNEPRVGDKHTGRENYPHYKKWQIDTVNFIRSLDKNHLIATGSEGAKGTLDDMDMFKDSHDTPNIDYLTCHLWVKNRGWFDAEKPEETYDYALKNALQYLDEHEKVACELNKPVVIEEFGVERDNADYRIESGCEYRNRFFNQFFNRIYASAMNGKGLVGSNFWSWGGEGRASNSDYIWQEGDDLVGDPPQEPQGLNSIFSCDTSTLQLLKESATQLNELSKSVLKRETICGGKRVNAAMTQMNEVKAYASHSE